MACKRLAVYTRQHTQRFRKLKFVNGPQRIFTPRATLQALIYGIFKHAAAAIRTDTNDSSAPCSPVMRYPDSGAGSGFRFYSYKPSQKTTGPCLPMSVSWKSYNR